MAGRIRTVKPELFIDDGLVDAEEAAGLPPRSLRWVFAGLFTQADREGRFKWRPKLLKTQIAPYDDDFDFGDALDALASAGNIAKYSADGEQYGVICKWHEHQRVRTDEATSVLPDPTLFGYDYVTNPSRSSDESESWKGREGKGKELEGKKNSVAPAGDDGVVDAKVQKSRKDEAMNGQYRTWASGLEGRDGNSPALVRRYIAAMEEAVQEYYDRNRGQFTPTRKAAFAKRMSRFQPDVQMFAIEVFVDAYTGKMPERYLVGIADKKSKLSRQELEAAWHQHRRSMGGHGLADVLEG